MAQWKEYLFLALVSLIVFFVIMRFDFLRSLLGIAPMQTAFTITPHTAGSDILTQ